MPRHNRHSVGNDISPTKGREQNLQNIVQDSNDTNTVGPGPGNNSLSLAALTQSQNHTMTKVIATSNTDTNMSQSQTQQQQVNNYVTGNLGSSNLTSQQLNLDDILYQKDQLEKQVRALQHQLLTQTTKSSKSLMAGGHFRGNMLVNNYNSISSSPSLNNLAKTSSHNVRRSLNSTPIKTGGEVTPVTTANLESQSQSSTDNNLNYITAQQQQQSLSKDYDNLLRKHRELGRDLDNKISELCQAKMKIETLEFEVTQMSRQQSCSKNKNHNDTVLPQLQPTNSASRNRTPLDKEKLTGRNSSHAVSKDTCDTENLNYLRLPSLNLTDIYTSSPSLGNSVRGGTNDPTTSNSETEVMVVNNNDKFNNGAVAVQNHNINPIQELRQTLENSPIARQGARGGCGDLISHPIPQSLATQQKPQSQTQFQTSEKIGEINILPINNIIEQQPSAECVETDLKPIANQPIIPKQWKEVLARSCLQSNEYLGELTVAFCFAAWQSQYRENNINREHDRILSENTKKYESEITLARRESMDLTGKLNQTKELARKAEEEKGSVETNLMKLKKIKQDVESELRNEIENLKTKNEAAESSISSLQNDLAFEKNEKSKLSSLIDEQTTEITKLKDDLKCIEQQNSKLDVALKAVESTTKRKLKETEEDRDDIRKRYHELMKYMQETGETAEGKKMQIIRENTLLKEIAELKIELGRHVGPENGVAMAIGPPEINGSNNNNNNAGNLNGLSVLSHSAAGGNSSTGVSSHGHGGPGTSSSSPTKKDKIRR